MLHLIEHGFYELHIDVLWLMSFYGEMVIYVFFLGFSSHSRQKEWFKIWKIRDQPNHTNHIKEPQNSHCLVVHEDAHLSYKWYKVEKPCFNGHLGYTSTSIHKHTLFLYFFSPFFIFIFLKKLKTKQKQINKQNIKTRLTQTTPRTMQEIRKYEKSLRIFFLLDGRPGWRSFLLHELLSRLKRRRVETIKVWKQHDRQ